jgi:hypothetical protein
MRECHSDLGICTGFSDAVMAVLTKSPVQSDDKKNSGSNESMNVGSIVGGVLGGLVAVVAGVFVIRSRRSKTDNFIKEWSEKAHAAMIREHEEAMVTYTGAALNASMGVAANNPEFQRPTSADLRPIENLNVPLRTRFSFHGDPLADELDVPAGVVLTGMSKNKLWWVAVDEAEQVVGLIPASYVNEM